MIVEGVVSAVVGLVNFIVGLFGSLPAPAWLSDAGAKWADLMQNFAGLGAWVPWDLARTIVLAVLACMAIGFTIKVVRLVASYVTAGGGSAG